MTRMLTLAIMTAFLSMAVALAAQSTSPPSQTKADNQVTITGCVERADQLNPAGSTAAATVDSLDFVLVEAAPEGSGTKPIGTTGSTSTDTKRSMYRLDGDTSAINSHVGHKVEVVGTVAEPQSSTVKEPESAANAPKMKVSSIKMLASTCGR
jgi:hypothetical protein